VEEPVGKQGEPRIIRRYANRKLYDATESRYVTLQDVEALVRRGVEVRVLDNRTGEDVTQTALAQILCDAGRRGDPRYSLSNLLALFRRGDIEERVRGFLRSRGAERPATPAAGGAEPPAGEVPVAAGDAAEPHLRDVLAGLAQDIQRRVDERLAQILGDLEPLRRLNRDVRALGERVASLERAVGARDARRAARKKGP
jgi:polyhydroxyalkanoate synthesis repressor PhaR